MGLFSRKPKKEEPKKAPESAPVKDAPKEIKKEELSKPHGQTYKHLLKPVMTEKSTFLSYNNQYIFEVSPRANKTELKKAVENLYGVKPIKINIIKELGKKVRQGRSFGKKKDWKKAIVILKKEDKIEVYSGV